MIRWSGVASLSLSLVALGIGGCARRAVLSPESTTTTASSPIDIGSQETSSESTLPAVEPAASLDIREIKLIEDNGQQGLFVKLTGPPAGVTHYALTEPDRLVIDIAGVGAGASGTASAQKYTVQNPLVSAVGVARNDGKIRVTVDVRNKLQTYTVNDLNDTVIAFLGEPSGGNEQVREQLVFTRRVTEARASQDTEPVARPQPVPQPPATVRADTPSRDVPAAATDTGAVTEPRLAGRQYHGQHVSLDFKDADVHNVLRLLAEVSKLNVVATGEVSGKVTLRLFDMPWDQALDIVLQVLNLESVQEGNVIRISSVRRLREEREELQRAHEAAKALESLRVEYIKINYAKASKLADIISGAARSKATVAGRTTALEEPGVLSSRGSVFIDEYSNTLVVRDIQRGIDNARELVRHLDVQTPQVLIESNIVEATTSFERDLGVQWGYRNLTGPQTGNPTGFNFPGMIAFGGSGLGVGTGNIPFLADFPAGGNFAVGKGSALDLALGSLDGQHSLDVRLTALESEGKAHIISRPRVVTLNNVPATIKSLTILRVKLPSTGTVINTGAGGAAGTASTATEKIETGIVLIVTPQVSTDGYVLLDMSVKSSQADFTRKVDEIPTEISREATSHVLVKDGQTVVLGGIYRDDVSQNRNGLPFFKDIPGLGWLFRSLSNTSSREDLLVFLTPRILGGAHAGLPSAEELWLHRN